MVTKVCTKCGVEKVLEEFHKAKNGRFGVRSDCKQCIKIIMASRYIENAESLKQKQKKYYGENKKKILESTRAYKIKWREENKERLDLKKREWYPQNREAVRIRVAEYAKKNESKIKEYGKKYRQLDQTKIARKHYKKLYKECNPSYASNYVVERCKVDVDFRLKVRLRSRLHNFIRINGFQKRTQFSNKLQPIVNHIGPPPGEGYHIDHIIPLSKFNFELEEHQKLAMIPENHQWLPGVENLQKSDNIDLELIRSNPILMEIAVKIGLV